LVGERQRGLERDLELAVAAGGRVLRRVVDLDVGIGAVVLDAEADIGEPERELGLGRLGAVDEAVPWPDADDAAPVRVPTSGPIFISLTLCEKMSPSEPACSLVSVTTAPATASSGRS
jgi:hypothetical protein